ncbi:MAG: hypothetical protein KJO64_06840 [Bacteroidia bacterium]|nr:hypothetical protein [Bacteroidia bacterium]
MKILITFLLLFTSISANGQFKKVIFTIDGGLGTGWWIQESDYKIQDATITDWANSRLSLDAEFSSTIQYNLKNKFHAGLGYTYHTLMAQNLYASSPFIPSRTKTQVSESSVNFHQYYVTLGVPILQKSRVQLIPNINVGSFSFESLHPDDYFFTRPLLLEAKLKMLFPSKQSIHPYIEMYYSNLSFKSNVTFVYKRVHHVQSVGTKIGIAF